MSDRHEVRFDSFVVKLWRLAEVGTVIRVEIEHVQSADHSKSVWRDRPGEEASDIATWILEQLIRPVDGSGA